MTIPEAARRHFLVQSTESAWPYWGRRPVHKHRALPKRLHPALPFHVQTAPPLTPLLNFYELRDNLQ